MGRIAFSFRGQGVLQGVQVTALEEEYLFAFARTSIDDTQHNTNRRGRSDFWFCASKAMFNIGLALRVVGVWLLGVGRLTFALIAYRNTEQIP